MAIFQLLTALIFSATLSTTVLFTAGTSASGNSSIVANPNTATADGVGVVSLTFTARDTYNNLAANVTVNLAASGSSNIFASATGATDANGQFTTTLSSSVAQSKTVTATFAGNNSVSCAVNFVAGPASAVGSSLVVNPNTTAANNSSTLTAILILRDAQSNPIAGITPSFSASGSSTSVIASGDTSSSGQASASYQTGLAQNENAVVTAGGITLSAPLVFTAGSASVATSSFVVNPNSTIANNTNTLTAVLTLRDAQGNPIAGITPNFSASGSSTTVVPSGNTTAAGQASASYKTSLAQNENAVVTAGGITLSAPIIFSPGPASAGTSSLVANPNTAIANNSNTLTAVLILRDAQSNPIAGITPSFTASGSSTTVTPSGNTSAAGQASASYQSGLAQNENAVVTAGGITLSAPLAFTAGSASGATSSFVASPNTSTADNSSTLSAVLILRDAQSNPIAGITPSFSASGSSTTVTPSGNTTASGQASASYKTSLAQNQNAVVTAGGITLSAPIIFAAGPASAATSSLAASPNSTMADNSSTLSAVLILRDAQSNPIAGITPSFSASGLSTTVTPSGNTNAGGQASATYKTGLAQNENAVVTAGGITLNAPIVFAAGSASVATSSFVVSPNSTIANNSNTLTAVLILRDAQSNPIVGATPSFSASGSSTTVTASGNTSASGQAQANYKSTLAQNENAVVTAGGITLSAPIVFAVGPASATASSLVASPNSTIADNSSALSAVLILRDAQSNPIGGITPSFSASGSSTTVTPSGNTNAGGQASASYKTGLAQNENAVVTAGGITLSTPIVFAAGTASLSTSSLIASPNSTTADNASTLTAVLVLRDAQNNPIVGATPSFSASGSSTTVTASGNTSASGQASASYKTGLAQNENAVVTAGGLTLSAPIVFAAGAASMATSSLVVNPNSTIANNSNTLTAVLILRDAQSNPIVGATPVFSASGSSTTVTASGNTSAGGQATATYKTSLAQNENAVVTAGGLTLSAPIIFAAGSASVATSSFVVSPNSTVANNSNTLTAALILRDAQNNPIVGATPSFSASGSSTTIAPSGNTSTSGQASASYKTSLAQNENAVVAAGGITLVAPIIFAAGAASLTTSSLIVNPNSSIADNSSTLTAVLTLRDAQSNPIVGATPSFSASGSSTTVAPSGNTSASGQASATYKTSLAQNENAVVTAGGITLSAPIIYVAGPASASASSFVASPNTTIANNSSTLSAVLTLRDAQSNPIAGATPSFSASGSSTTVTPSGSTSVSGQASASYKTTLAQNQNAVVSAAGVTLSAPIIFTAGPAAAAASSLLVNPNSTIANNSNTLTAVLTLRDAQANPIAGVTPSFSASGLSTTVTPSGNTSASGQAQATYKTTLAQNENAIVTAGGITLNARTTFTAGPAAAAYSTLTASPNTVAGDGNASISLVATAKDAQNNAVSNASVALSASGSNNTFGSASGITMADGTYTTTLKSTQAQTETINANIASSFTETVSVTFSSNVPTKCVLSVSPSSQPANGNSIIALSATVSNNSNQPVSGVRVNFASTGAAQTFKAQSVVTSAAGKALSNLTSLNAGKNTLFAQFGNVQCASQGNFVTRTPYCTGNPNFSIATYNTSTYPQGIVAGDFDGDGDQDLAIVNHSVSNVGIFLGTGTGTFQSQVTYATGSLPVGITMGDFNSDGVQDLAVTAGNSNTINILMGTGTGAFQAQVSYATDNLPQGITTGDFNGDGVQDLAVTNNSSGTLGIYLNQGTGTFQNAGSYATGATPKNIATGDFNGDGNQDLAVVNDNANSTVGVFIGTGAGTFAAQATYAVGSTPWSVAAGDFNGDGKQDLAVTNRVGSTVSILIGTGTGSFAAQVTYATSSASQGIAVADLNGDGLQDLAIVNGSSTPTLGVLLGTGTGSFQAQSTFSTGSFPGYVVTADFNGDGKQDLAVTNGSDNTMSIYLTVCP